MKFQYHGFMDLDALLARRVRDLRRARSLTLDQLAELSGVSRSMISLIERQETSPTAAVLNKLAAAFGISMAALFTTESSGPEPEPVARREAQPVWTDPASGYTRRHLSPARAASPFELVEVVFPAGASVLFDTPVRPAGLHQQLWMLEGEMAITHEAKTWRLAPGDCLAMELGAQIRFHNPSMQPARYLLALAGHTRQKTP
ncbi:helix-turn-helix domain-containing protein [Uliginosibacterium paludis]|uniref:XRE family transcriptional regulator n=1 Tax=Uliginosibacterium paludis TaxID=1615952 RepID=A0ABV2CMF7_9RHOO